MADIYLKAVFKDWAVTNDQFIFRKIIYIHIYLTANKTSMQRRWIRIAIFYQKKFNSDTLYNYATSMGSTTF